MNFIFEKINFFINYRLKFFGAFLFNKKSIKKKRILFYPRLPHYRTIIYKLCKELGLKITGNPSSSYDILFVWEDKTFAEKINLKFDKKIAVNVDCIDISKKKVDSVFESVFGYGLKVNPEKHPGRCVMKSNINARHDGKIINCPVTNIEEDVVYQKIIDNTYDKNYVKDIRVPIFGKSIPLVYYKFKKTGERFTNEIDHVEVHETSEVFNNDEIKKIILFAEAMNLDYGELDILRNKEDEKIYIVDVNKTPWGPPATISKGKADYVIEKMSTAFIELIS